MCMCLAFQSRHLPEWEDSLAKVFLDRVTAAAIVAARPDPPGGAGQNSARPARLLREGHVGDGEAA